MYLFFFFPILGVLKARPKRALNNEVKTDGYRQRQAKNIKLLPAVDVSAPK